MGALALFQANGRAAGLEIAAGAATRDLAVGAGPGQPHLQVVGAGCREAHIAGAELDFAVGQFQGFEHRFRVGGDLLMGLPRVVGVAEPIELHLVELVQANQAAGVAAVGPRFPAEAGAVGHVAERQLVGGDHLIAMQGGDGNFSGGGEPEVVVGAAEAFFGEFGQLARAGQAGGVHQDGRQNLPVALAGVQIEHEVDQAALEPGPLAHQGHKAALGDPHRALRFKQAQALGDLPVLLKGFTASGQPG